MAEHADEYETPPDDRGGSRPRRSGVGRTLLVGVVVVVAVLGGVLVTTLLAAGDGGGPPAPLGSGAQLLPGAPGADAGPLPGALPEAPIQGFAGAPPVDPASYRGTPLVVNLWATWCAPCVEEMPHFQTVSQELDGEVAFLGVDVQDGPARAEPFVEELGISYDLAADPRREFTQAVGAFGMPTTLFVDEGGRIVHRVTGPLSVTALREAVETHLGAG